MLYDLMNLDHLEPDQPCRQPAHQTYADGQIALGLVPDQDAHNLPRVQEGMNSRAFDERIPGDQELRIRHVHTRLMDDVGIDVDDG